MTAISVVFIAKNKANRKQNKTKQVKKLNLKLSSHLLKLIAIHTQPI
jgi:hypothetical protein